MKLIPVVLSGGAGTRLWPVSREAEPKPFITLPDGQSLIQKVLLRAFALGRDHDVPEVVLVTNRDYLFRTTDEYRRLPAGEYPALRLVLEPAARNTAPAIALAAHAVAAAHGPDAIMLVLPADHLIADIAAFRQAATAAVRLAETGRLVTFGIAPTRPEPGFGYIECGAPLGDGSYTVSRFVEKPPIERATEFLAAGNYVWNSGMFCFRADALLAAVAALAPALAGSVDGLWTAHRDGAFDGLQTIEFDPDGFSRLPDLSLDYAVMEKAADVACVRAIFDWSDIGSWQALSEMLPADADGNRRTGRSIAIGTRNTAIHARDRLIAVVGVDDLVIVDTPDALLVAHRDRTQRVKEIVAELRRTGDESYRYHYTTARPWGSYTVLQEGPGFKIKRIEVHPGQTLSLQMHHRRSEHWIVVRGEAAVTCGERTFPLAVNQSTFIPVETRHRLANEGTEPLVMIEVQCGDYLGEDDIVRFDDRYGRVSP